MNAVLDRYMPWLAYPGTITLGLLIHMVLLGLGQSMLVSTYIPVFIGALSVTLLELRFPNEVKWKPDRCEVGQDAVYMVLVQMLVPKLLAFAVVLTTLDAVGQSSAPFFNWWPQEFPIAIQAVMMILGADFLRYWLHLASHRIPWLWRLHAVHHSPKRLYWLNVGRFHPIEKALQFLLDTLPFILLGVSEAVVALYFVFYAINGFFQHSNIRLRFGLLNYVISSAELHRWHHSRLPEESNTNFGNNVIIWDLLFGTRFLPEERTVGELGLNNRHYPNRFFDQLMTPFTKRVTDFDVPVKKAGQWLYALLLSGRMQWIRRSIWKPFVRATVHPEATQQALLESLIGQARETRFGKDHSFADIQSYRDFTRCVPVQNYESLRPYIEAQEAGEDAALTVESPFMYAVTSGTTGEPKYIPVLDSTLQQYKEGQQLFSLMMYQTCPDAFEGKAFGVASPAVEGHRASGIPYGSVSGHLYASMPRLVRANYVVPPEVSAIANHVLKYRVMLRLALAEPNITYLAGANASSFLQLLSVLNDSRDAFIESLECGGMCGLGELDSVLTTALAGRLNACPERARQLRRLASGTELSYDILWPNIKLATVWTGGSCGVAVGALKRALPQNTRVIDLGILASELRATVTVDPATGAGLPMVRQHFYEFVERGEWEAGGKCAVRLHELQEGCEYYLIVTTSAGLYRYFMNDIVRVVGRFNDTPTLRFVQKGRGVTNITGEKLYEHQMLEAVGEVLKKYAINPVFIMTLADEEESRYHVYVEPISDSARPDEKLSETIDSALCKINIEYNSKRSSERLAMLSFNWLSWGTSNAYRQHCVAKGQREGQFKPVSLQCRSEFTFPIETYVQRNA